MQDSKCGAHNGRCWLWPHTTMGPFDSSRRPYMFLYPQIFCLSFWVSSCMFTVWPVWCEGMTAFIQVTVRWTMSSCEKKKVLVLGVLPWIKDRRSLMVKGKVTVTQTAFSHQLVTCKQWGLRLTVDANSTIILEGFYIWYVNRIMIILINLTIEM